MDEIFRGILKKTPSLGRRWKLLEVYLVEAAEIELTVISQYKNGINSMYPTFFF